MATKRKRPNTKRRKVLYGIIALCILLTSGYILLWILRPKSQTDMLSSVESWLVKQDYEMLRPFRGELPVGTVLRLEKHSHSLAIPASDFSLPPLEPPAAVPDVRWRVNVQMDGTAIANVLPGLDSASLSGAGAVSAVVEMADLRIHTIPLIRLGEAVRHHQRLIRAAEAGYPLAVVSEIIEAGSFKCTFYGADQSQLDLRGNLKDGSLGVESQFDVHADGVVQAKTPVVLGYKAYHPKSEALALDPRSPDRVVTLSPFNVEEIRKVRSSLSGLRTVRSEYQIHALCVGLGNYREAPIPGAPDSARRVAARLREVIGDRNLGHVELKVSAARDNATFDQGRRYSKDRILGWVKDFVAASRERVNPDQDAIAVLYFCGHGLADGFSHWAYIVPEDFHFRTESDLLDIREQLINVSELTDVLAPLAEPRLLLIDSCRTHEAEDVKYLNWWEDKLGQNRRSMGDLVDVLQFASAIYGPSPILFGSPTGQETPVIRAPWSDRGVGPVSLRFDLLIAELQRQGGDLSVGQFVQEMQIPVPSGLGSTTQIRGYSSIRKHFLQELPEHVLFGVSPQNVARRETPYVPVADQPSDADESFENWSSGVVVSDVGSVRIDQLTDFAYSSKLRRFWATDWQHNLWSWTYDDPSPHKMRAELHFPSIECTDDGKFYLHVAEDHQLFLSRQPGELNRIGSELYIGFLTRGSNGASVLVVEDDSTVETKDAVVRWSDERMEVVAEIDSSDVTDLIEWNPGEVIYSYNLEGCIYRVQAGHVETLAEGLANPAALAAGSRFVFCLGAHGRLVYRISRDGGVAYLDLLDVGFPTEHERIQNSRGLHCVNDELLWVATTNRIVSLDLSRAQWRTIP